MPPFRPAPTRPPSDWCQGVKPMQPSQFISLPPALSTILCKHATPPKSPALIPPCSSSEMHFLSAGLIYSPVEAPCLSLDERVTKTPALVPGCGFAILTKFFDWEFPSLLFFSSPLLVQFQL